MIAGLNSDKRFYYTTLATATASEPLPGNVPIRALTVNCWFVQWLKQSIHTRCLLDCTADSYDLFFSDVRFMLLSSPLPHAKAIAGIKINALNKLSHFGILKRFTISPCYCSFLNLKTTHSHAH